MEASNEVVVNSLDGVTLEIKVRISHWFFLRTRVAILLVQGTFWFISRILRCEFTFDLEDSS